MPFVPQTQPWPADSALLLVHGVGSYVRKDYDTVLGALERALGPAIWSRLAVYTVLYDEVNDWFAEKTQAAAMLQTLVGGLQARFPNTNLGQIAAEAVGDVVWPILSRNARAALREAILVQLRQVVLDGDAKGVLRRQQKLHVLGHSLGCFHAYEALWAAATDGMHGLQPVNHGVRFASVVMIASPVQLIRTVAGDLQALVPAAASLATLGQPLGVPAQRQPGFDTPSVRRFVSLTGDLDPVGGHLFHQRLPWAYMDLAGAESVIEPQNVAGGNTEPAVADALERARAAPLGISLTPDNPHDWVAYVDRNANRIANWLA